jgi:hypothetical protein
MCRRFLFAVFLLVPGLLRAETPTAAQKHAREEIEQFLLKAKVVRTRNTSTGITGSIRATLTDGNLTHDAHIQTIDVAMREFQGQRGTELNFRDTWKFNIAGYRLALLLGLDNVPASVERKYGGKAAAFTWWVDDVMADEMKRRKDKLEPPDKDWWARQMHVLRVFDQLIYNTDRNLGNLLITKQWRIWMIDHTRAFRLYRTLLSPKDLQRCDRQLLEKLRQLDEPTLMRETKGYLMREEIRGLLARRDVIVRYFEDEIKRKGEGAVLYTLAQ